MSAAPVSLARVAASSSASSTEPPPSRTWAPSRSTAATFETAASRGMKTSQPTPLMRAACATARAWLPALAATRPSAARSPSAATFASAPRSLKEPVPCSDSAFRATGPPAGSERSAQAIVGVRTASAEIACWARSMSMPALSSSSVGESEPGAIGAG